MGFYESMHDELLEEYNSSLTEKGAEGYRTTGKSLLDLNFAVASLRSATEKEIMDRFEKAFFEDRILAVKWLFFARDVRGGLGERRLFRTAMKVVADCEPEFVKKLLPLFAEYGRWDDMWGFLEDERFLPEIMDIIRAQLAADIENRLNDRPISLLAKWLPSVNTHSSTTKRYARIIRRNLNLSEKQYRQTLARLRSYLDVVEQKMSSDRWGEISYEAVPSRANLIYKDAFLRHDKERREAFLEALEKGEATINASVLYPHDIVHKYSNYSVWSRGLHAYDASVEALWKALPDMVGSAGNTMVVADGSGSMITKIGGGNVTALEVANALAIYFAERSSGEFRNKFITFSEQPQLVDLSGGESLRDKLAIALQYSEVGNTNIEAVFDLILQTAVKNGMRQEEIPANILIISDMEFDACAVCGDSNKRHGTRYADQKLFRAIEQRYAENGYKLPRLVFWNVNSRTGTIPMRKNELGVALVSGFSVNICKMVMSGKLDPMECLLETVNSERYQPVEDAIKA